MNLTKVDVPQAPVSPQVLHLHPALHFDEQFASVGILDYEKKLWIVTSERRLLPSDDPSIRLTTPPLIYEGIANKWDIPDLNKFLAGGGVQGVGVTVNWIKEILNHYCQFQYDAEETLIACWIVGTYFHQLFPTYPRLFLHGERGTAKSKVLSIIAATAFNGVLRLNPTPATLFRLIHPVRPTLCLDETETLAGHDKPDLLSILNAGYKRGGSVDRCVGDAHDLRSFEVFSPIALAGIEGLNKTTEDRSITVMMLPGKDHERVNREVIDSDQIFSEVRAHCYRLALTLFHQIEQERRSLILPGWLKGRHRELYAPLIAVASLADCDGDRKFVGSLLTLAQWQLAHRAAGSYQNEAIMDYLRGQLEKNDPYQARPGTLALVLEDVLHKISPEKLGHILGRGGFQRTRDQRGTYYIVTRERFAEWEAGL